jgi:rhodanese-related sulfurtransferase
LAKKALPWIIVGGVLLIIAVFSFKPAGGAVSVVDVAGVQKAAASGTRLVDVRSPGEFQSGHVPGAQSVPLDQLQSVAPQWNKNAPVLVYCQTGSRSAQAVTMLQKLGFKKILHFDKGIVAWTGELQQGAAAAAPPGAAAPTPKLQASALPIMYEFYTGW